MIARTLVKYYFCTFLFSFSSFDLNVMIASICRLLMKITTSVMPERSIHTDQVLFVVRLFFSLNIAGFISFPA